MKKVNKFFLLIIMIVAICVLLLTGNNFLGYPLDNSQKIDYKYENQEINDKQENQEIEYRIENQDKEFVYTEDTQLKLCGENYYINGMCASNAVASSPLEPNVNMMTEQDYRELCEMGINTVRFLFNYNILEDDNEPYKYKQSGWSWFDQNIDWAEKYNIKIIIDCHLSQGGMPENGGNDNVWQLGSSNQERLVAMWAAIAERYYDCTTVLGYGLLNEPVITEKESNQWTILAQRITDRIRMVDKNHIIIVQRAKIKKTNKYSVPEIIDSNWMLEIHKYPTLNMKFDNDMNIQSEHFIYGNSNILVGVEDYKVKDTDFLIIHNDGISISDGWKEYSFFTEAVKDTNCAYLAVAVCDIESEDSIFEIKDLTVKECETGNILYSLERNIANQYSYYSTDNEMAISYLSSENQISFIGDTQYADVADNSIFRFFSIEEGKKYIINFKARTQNRSDERAKLRISMNYCKASIINRLDQTYLFQVLNCGDLKEKYNVPIFYGEIGVRRDLYEREDVKEMFSDVLMWLRTNETNFAWFCWHEPNYGIYTNSGLEPKENYNEDLAELIKSSID